MDEDPIEAYNSDSGDGEFQMDDISDDQGAKGAGDLDGEPGAAGWIQWFCSLDGHEYMIEVDDAYIRDHHNLFGLHNTLGKDKFKQCLKMILSPTSPNEEDLADEQFLELNQEASDLYGLIHCRFINSSLGQAKVYHKFLNGLYGHCPRALCDRQKVLPVGLSDSMKVSRFKVYCPRCEEVYIPKFRSVNIDGGFFGTAFPHQFLKHYPQAVILPPKVYYYEPKINGFHIVGKRGSKHFTPTTGNVRFNEDSMTGIDKEKQVNKIQSLNGRTNRFASSGGPSHGDVQSLTQQMLN